MAEDEKPAGPRVRIESYEDYPSRKDGRTGKLDRVLRYYVDAEGPYHLIMPAENWTWDSFLERVKEQMDEREKILGRTVRME